MENLAKKYCSISKNSKKINDKKRIEKALDRMKTLALSGNKDVALVFKYGVYCEGWGTYNPDHVLLHEEDLDQIRSLGFKVKVQELPGVERKVSNRVRTENLIFNRYKDEEFISRTEGSKTAWISWCCKE